MTIVTVGKLEDKRLRCSYCSYEIDLPDSYSETEERRSEDGRTFFRRTVTRSDGASAAPQSLLETLGLNIQPHEVTRFSVVSTHEQKVITSVEGMDKLPKDVVDAIEAQLSERVKELGAAVVVVPPEKDDAKKGNVATKIYLVWASVALAVIASILFGQKGLFGAICVLALGWAWRAWRRLE